MKIRDIDIREFDHARRRRFGLVCSAESRRSQPIASCRAVEAGGRVCRLPAVATDSELHGPVCRGHMRPEGGER